MYIPLLLAFTPAYFLLSVTPGLNMLASMNISAAYGINRAFPFIFGAAFGVAVVAILSITGVTTVMQQTPIVFEILKYAGAAFLVYIGFVFLRDKGEVTTKRDTSFAEEGRQKLVAKGFFTATLNPKGWLFFAAFLPAFLLDDAPLQYQIALIVAIVMSVELACMLAYAFGGSVIGRLISASGNVRVLNKINAVVMFVLAYILVFG